MPLLYCENITDLFVWIDEMLPKRISEKAVGRPRALTDGEMVTILVWNVLVLKHKNWKDLHRFLRVYHRRDFPRLPKYNTFLVLCHRVAEVCFRILQRILITDAPLKFMDGTMLPVCKHKRADDHKVAKGTADFGKNWQGWHYGFKLHASVTRDGKLCALAFSQASVHEKNIVSKLLGAFTRVAVGDSSYGGKNPRETLWKTRGTYILAPAFHGQKKLMAQWQKDLLEQRSCIESVFDYLKEHLHLVTSFPRSVYGYLAHYAMVLLGYQVMKIWKI
ncbi:MAG: IS982 family transposase [bacterium]